jgi:hypothetical protein
MPTPLAVPANTVVWQVVCQACGARYALVHADQAEAPRPRHCAFCAARAAFFRVEAQ